MMNNPSLFDLTKKVVLITGASKGIGEAIAQLFAQHGAHVVINSRKQEELEVVKNSILQQGGLCAALVGNVGEINFCKSLILQTLEKFGRLDILINNAASNPVYGPIVDTEEWAFDKIMQVNVKAPFELAKAAYPYLKKSGQGSIINISSIAGITPDPGLGIYSVSKAALNMLTKVKAKEWGKDGIRVNAICPGLIKTKFSKALWDNEKTLQHFTTQLPLPRMGNPEEIAALALFLASPAASYITGSIYTADGGATI